MKRFVALFLVISCACMFTACNTMHGLGKDVEKVGEKIQEKSAK